MKVLLVKTSSLGDLIHSMPAVTELAQNHPDIELHWLVEEGFSDIPLWHPFVKKTHSCAVRRWRKSLFSRVTRNEIKALKQSLLSEGFDRVIDAQGLIKTAFMVRWFSCKTIGFDKQSIKEPLASLAYERKIFVAKGQNAILRVKQLLAAAFNYPVSHSIEFGLQVNMPESFAFQTNNPYVICLHGTVWPSKVWPEEYWIDLANRLLQQGYEVLFPFGDDSEKTRAERICQNAGATLLPKCSLNDLAFLLQQASAVVGSDTGLSHIAAALAVPVVGLYGPTDRQLTGLVGNKVLSLQSEKTCSPCLKRDCPLIKDTPESLIPCYESIGVSAVIDAVAKVAPDV